MRMRAMMMMMVLAESQGRVWQGICLMLENMRRMLTRIMTTQTEKRDKSRLVMKSPFLMPPISRDEVLRYLEI